MSARPGLGRLGLAPAAADAVGLAGRACFHVLSVVKWLTRWTVENSSCKPVTWLSGWRAFCRPPCQQSGPNGTLGGFGKLKNFALMCAFLLSQTCNRFSCLPWRLLWHYLSMTECHCQA